MNFWDSSALVPLIVREPNSAEMMEWHAKSHPLIVWALTPVEILSALSRLRRIGGLTSDNHARAIRQFVNLRQSLVFVRDIEAVSDRAERLLNTHPLKAADALQLASALVACQDHPSGHHFITLDDKLRHSAQMEGFKTGPN